jgi:hypothetical protein
MKLLMAHRGRPGEEEAEPVLVEVIGSRAILKLDDGEEVAFDLGELREVLDGGTGPPGERRHDSCLPADQAMWSGRRRSAR